MPDKHEEKLRELNMHDGYRINDELTVYRVPGGLLYVSYKKELFDAGPSLIKEILSVPTASTFVPYQPPGTAGTFSEATVV